MSAIDIADDRPLLTHDKLFIGGEFVPPADGNVVDSVNPATGLPLARVAEGTTADIDRAVAAAREAFASPAWRGMTPSERGGLMIKLADLIRRDAKELAEVESRDNGQTLGDTTNDVAAVANWFQYYGGLADKIQGAAIPVKPDWHSYTIREPVGVVGAIIPWNGPLLMCSWKLGPALAAGCTVVIKPAEQTPITALMLAKLIAEAGFPPGVVNVVTGVGEVVGRHLAEHPDVDKIAFTGSHETAKDVIRRAAGTLKRVSAECGGKAPQIIFGDADLRQAMNNATFAAFRRTGQTCAQGSRVLVQRDVYDEVVEGIGKRTERVQIGDPRDPNTFMGPHTFPEKLENTLEYMTIGRDEGARVVVDGGRPDGGANDGFWIRPMLFADVDPNMRIAQEEIFGPVLTIIPFEDEDEAIEISNSVVYGLTAGVWTNDAGRAHRMIAAIESGTVSVNAYPTVHWMLPYGGMKLSGFGRENGQEAINLYTETKTAVVNVGTAVPPSPFDD